VVTDDTDRERPARDEEEVKDIIYRAVDVNKGVIVMYET
jgi:hypothetical protein